MTEPQTDPKGQEWHFNSRKAALMLPLVVVAGLASLPGFGWLSRLFRPSISFSMTGRPEEALQAILTVLGVVLVTLAATVGLFLLHEWCHGLAFRRAGATPRYGAKMVAWFFPVFYATAPGRWMTRRQYLVVALAPTLVVNGLGLVLLAALISWNWVVVLPLALHLGGCVGDWWLACAILKRPAATLFEDTEEGFRYHLPS